MFLVGDGTGWDAVVPVVGDVSTAIVSAGFSFSVVTFAFTSAVVFSTAVADNDSFIVIIVLVDDFLYLVTWVHSFAGLSS